MRVCGVRWLLVSAVFATGCAGGAEADVLTARVDSGPPTSETSPADDTGASDGDPSLDAKLPTTVDVDGDGYALEDDCDDGNPLINPGAIEVPGDGVDNDCNGKIDEVLADCDVGLALASADPTDFARSLGLCQTTLAGAKGKARTWGVISASLETSDGKGVPLSRQYGIQAAWGTNVVPRDGKSMVVLSSGVARTPGQPSYVPLPKGTNSSTNQNVPPTGWPRNTKGCPISSQPYAFDSVALKLVVRVPTNAKSFSYDFDFYTSEYVEYVCQAYNDSYVALLKTKSPLDPLATGNISYDEGGDPINVNSGFFQSCFPDSWLGRSFTCPRGTAELDGTGFDGVPSSITNPAQNGATGWLRTKQAVVPGEEIELRLMIWNTGDHWLPSTVLVDDFKWSADPTTKTVTERPK
jgi:hypothetical protein